MDYREQIGQAKNAAEKWHTKHPIVGVGELRVDLMVDDLCRSITDLLARAEAAEAERDEARQDCAVAERNHTIEVERRQAAEARAEKAERERGYSNYSPICDQLTKGERERWLSL